MRGPPASAAFSADGKPTKALEGFCRKNGVQVADVSREADAKGVEYVWVTVKDAGRTAAEALADELPGVVSGLNFKKSMRWAAGGAAFSRPVRWLLAMHGEQVVPFAALGLLADSETRGLRNSTQPLLQVRLRLGAGSEGVEGGEGGNGGEEAATQAAETVCGSRQGRGLAHAVQDEVCGHRSALGRL